MAGPSVVVRVLGDLSGLSKSMDATAKKGETVTASLKKNFSSMFSTLNATGVLGPFNDVFLALDQSFSTLEEHGNKVASAFQAAGAVAATTGALLTSLGSKDQAAQQQLAQAIDNTGHSWADYQGRVEEAIKSQEHFGNTAAETQNALQVLTQATNDPAKALHLLGLATDLAASKHESLTEASTQLGRAVNGNTRLLKEMGIQVPKVGTAVGDFATQADQASYIVTQLTTKLHGDAAAAADTFTGHIHALTAAFEDQAAVIGQKYGPALTAVGSAVTIISTGYKTYTEIMKAAKTATEAETVAEEGADAAGLPLIATIGLIALAVAALVVIGYEIGTHWNAIWAGIKATVSAVWDWIKTNWPLLLSILLGPIATAAYEIYKHWDAIRAGIEAVWTWLKSEWSQVYHFLVDPIIGAANAIVDAFKAAFNAVADLWNDSIGSLHFDNPLHFFGIGPKSVSVPDIPHLAQGGLITQSGLVFAHAGEAITPMDKSFGPAINIENAQFNEPVDLDLLIKRVEFALSAGLPV